METTVPAPTPSSPAPVAPSVVDDAERTPRYSYYALAVLTFVNFLNYIDRNVFPSVAISIKRDLQLTDTELGAMEAALLLSFTVLAPLFGRLGDRYSRTKLMASAAVIWSIATAVTGMTEWFPVPPSIRLNIPIIQIGLGLSGVAIVLCMVRAVVGVGESSYSTITPGLIADYFPLKKRATALGTFQAAIPMGFALGYVIGAVLAHYFGWRAAFMVVGVPGIATAFFVWRLKEPERGRSDAVGHPPVEGLDQPHRPAESWLRTSWHILCTRDWLLSTVGYTALTFVLGAFALWAPSLLAREKGMSETGAGIALGVVTLVGGAAGTFGGGWLADRVAAKRHNGYFLVCAVSSFLGVIPTIVALVADNPVLYLPAIFLAVMFLFTNNAPFHAILINSVPPLVRATAVALNIVIIHTFGDVISRFGVGVLSDSIEIGGFGFLASLARLFGINAVQEHLTTALLVAPAGLIISGLVFLVGGLLQERTKGKLASA
jgi:MFS family permease